MTNVNKALVACAAGTVALACAAIPPANAADMPPQYPPQYSGPPVEQGYVYPAQPRVYAPPPQVYYQGAPPVVVVPEPYYVPRRRVYVEPGYGGYGYGYRPYYRSYGPYVAGGYGYYRGGGWGRRW